MKITSIFTPIKRRINTIIGKPSHSTVSAPKKTADAMEVLAAQNKAMLQCNQVAPLQTDFKSTKDALAYARKRCTDALKTEQPYEHAVIVDTKQNKVLAEYKGTKGDCRLGDFDSYVKNPEDTVIIHGHPENYPLSNGDVRLLLNNDINQVIAVNKNGEFSMAAKRVDRHESEMTKTAAKEYQSEISDINYDFYGHKNTELYKEFCDNSLKQHADGMGLRYITNYSSYKDL